MLVLLNSPLTTIKELISFFIVIEAYENDRINVLWSVKNSLDVLDEVRALMVPFRLTVLSF